jgi:hypothetical protein
MDSKSIDDKTKTLLRHLRALKKEHPKTSVEILIACAVAGAFGALEARLLTTQSRVAELEAKPTLKYAGTWCEGGFKAGELVTHAGSCWHANTDTISKPGTNADWTMVVRRGADGKDARR